MPLMMRKRDLVLYLRAQGWTLKDIMEGYPGTIGLPWWIQWQELNRKGFTTEEYAEFVGKSTEDAILDLIKLEARGMVTYHVAGPQKRNRQPPLWYRNPQLPLDENGNPPVMKPKIAKGRANAGGCTRNRLPKIKINTKAAKTLRGRMSGPFAFK
jgi:hypothetical protein